MNKSHALLIVHRGIKQAHSHKFAKPGPDLEAAAKLANQLSED